MTTDFFKNNIAFKLQGLSDDVKELKQMVLLVSLDRAIPFRVTFQEKLVVKTMLLKICK